MAAITIQGKGGNVTYLKTTPSEAHKRYEAETGHDSQSIKVVRQNAKEAVSDMVDRIVEAHRIHIIELNFDFYFADDEEDD